MASSRQSSLLAGARDTFPMLVGAAPFGLVFGTLAAARPLAPWQGQLMSLSIFAGSSQLIGLGLIAGHAGLLVIWATTFIVNLRHVLYQATLLPHVAGLPFGWRLILGFLLTDETFAVMTAYHARHADGPLARWYYLGSGVSMYLNWQLCTLAGILFAASLPGLGSLGLDFAMAATFIAIVVPLITSLPRLAAALAAGAVAWFGRAIPYNLGLLAAVLVGVVCGLALSRWQSRQRAETA